MEKTNTLERPVVKECADETLQWQKRIDFQSSPDERAEIAAYMVNLWIEWGTKK